MLGRGRASKDGRTGGQTGTPPKPSRFALLLAAILFLIAILLPQIEFGFSEDKGRFIRNFGYYYAPSDYWDASVWADYYEQTRWIGHLEGRYKRRYVLSGSVKASFMQELLYNKRRWDLKFSHRQEVGRVWTAGASGDFRSDATYASDDEFSQLPLLGNQSANRTMINSKNRVFSFNKRLLITSGPS